MNEGNHADICTFFDIDKQSPENYYFNIKKGGCHSMLGTGDDFRPDQDGDLVNISVVNIEYVTNKEITSINTGPYFIIYTGLNALIIRCVCI